jgi:hypothetical protein
MNQDLVTPGASNFLGHSLPRLSLQGVSHVPSSNSAQRILRYARSRYCDVNDEADELKV